MPLPYIVHTIGASQGKPNQCAGEHNELAHVKRSTLPPFLGLRAPDHLSFNLSQSDPPATVGNSERSVPMSLKTSRRPQ